jgi:hypothetical protein
MQLIEPHPLLCRNLSISQPHIICCQTSHTFKSIRPAIKMPSLSATTILLFGTSSLFAGASTLLLPHVALGNTLTAFALPLEALPAVYGNGLAATAMGVYYTLAAYQENKAFFLATVPLRLLTCVAFWNLGDGWRRVASWEGIAAVATGAALAWEKWLSNQERLVKN